MKSFLTAVLSAVVFLSPLGTDAQKLAADDALIAKAQKIHADVITLDTHNDINTTNFTTAINYTQDLPTQVNLPKMFSGGLDVSWMIVYTGQGDLTDDGYKRAYANAIDKFEAIHRLTEKIAPDKIELALTSNDVRRIIKSGKKVAMIGVENAYPIGNDISLIKDFAARGARYMSLAHNGHSQLADSNTGERDNKWLNNGLSDLGKQAIAEMNKWGIMIDLSHPSKQANLQAIALSKAPVIASHSGARAIADHSRNLDDEQLEAIKKNGGVVQAVALRAYVKVDKAATRTAKSADLLRELGAAEGFTVLGQADVAKLSPTERTDYQTKLRAFRQRVTPIINERLKDIAPDVNVSDFVDHIDYLVKKIGIDHVGIASDFDGGGGVEGWDNAGETFNVTLELVRRGYTKKQIAKIWSGNLLRVLDEVQKVSKELQKKG
ncbi:MAG: peptidase M19 [Acidobacteria bacterium]|nr:MAG: peptidase M19 [Acidobacteriota bacterium]